MLLDQVDDSLQDQILPRHRKPNGECLCNEAPDVAVNCIFAPGSRMPINDLQRVLWRHVTGGYPEYAVHDHCQIYDVAHYTTDILWAIGQKSQPGSWKKDHRALAYLPLNVSLVQSG